MKPNYKNWVPKGLVISLIIASVIAAVLLGLSLGTNLFAAIVPLLWQILFGIVTVILVVLSLVFINMYISFSYNGKRKLSAHIIDKVSSYMNLPNGGKCLDVGCGSGALTNAVAKKNPNAKVIGLDRWGREYASFNMNLCENNAKAEGVFDRVSFVQGNACNIEFEDESFDGLTSNYCYHNIPVKDRQQIIIDNLRLVKKGGTFVIHDLFSKNKYGDMNLLIQKLKDLGYEKVELIDTDNGLFLNKKDSKLLMLTGSKLLIGIK